MDRVPPKKLAPFNDIPIIFTSVLNKQRIFDVLQTAIRVYQSRKRRIPTSALNDFLLPLIENYPPPATKGKYIKIKYVTQLPTPTPQFAFFVNLPQYIKEPYRRFLENNMRDHWDFQGSRCRFTSGSRSPDRIAAKRRPASKNPVLTTTPSPSCRKERLSSEIPIPQIYFRQK